jgi:hypothetical protein
VGTDEKRGTLEIAVFARAPILGRVKRRLAADIGEREALAAYEELLRGTIAAVLGACRSRSELVPVLWHWGDWPSTFPLPAALSRRMRRQPHADMLANLHEALRLDGAPPPRGVIAVGADHPTIEPTHVLAVAALLDGCDVAVGPAEDGGFWALGTAVDLRDALRDLPVGTSRTLEALDRALAGAGLGACRGPTLWDVDTAADLARWRGPMHRE